MILVVGPGRCGSSAIARVLHEQMGVNMGQAFSPPDECNPEGYYEDLEFKTWNEGFLSGRVSFPVFIERINHLIGQREEPWGLKDPRLCYVLPYYLQLLDSVKIIRCCRDVQKVAKSMNRCYGWNKDEAVNRERMLDRVNVSYNLIDMNEPRSDGWIKDRLCQILES